MNQQTRGFGSFATGRTPTLVEAIADNETNAVWGGFGSENSPTTPDHTRHGRHTPDAQQTPAKPMSVAKKGARTNHRNSFSGSHLGFGGGLSRSTAAVDTPQRVSTAGPGNGSRTTMQYHSPQQGYGATLGSSTQHVNAQKVMRKDPMYGGRPSTTSASVERQMNTLNVEQTHQLVMGGGGATRLNSENTTYSANCSPQRNYMNSQYTNNNSQLSQLRASQSTRWGDSVMSQETTASQFLSRRIQSDFEEKCELGRGQFCSVTLVQEHSTKEYFAIKTHDCMSMNIPERSLQERDIMYMVRDLPHCVRIYNSWAEGRSSMKLYLQMQVCPNGSLANLIADRKKQNAPFTSVEALTVLGQMLMALDAMHAIGVAHVDVKPENILIDHDNNFVLSDFGHAVVLDLATNRPVKTVGVKRKHSDAGFPEVENNSFGRRNLEEVSMARSVDTMASQDEGDARYVSHDMLNKKRHYFPGDIFSLGLTMYELMSLQELPKSGAAYENLRRRDRLPELVTLGYDQALVDIVCSMIRFEPSQRPTALQLLEHTHFHMNSYTADWRAFSFAQLHSQCSPQSQDCTPDAIRFHETVSEIGMHFFKRVRRQATQLSHNPQTSIAEALRETLEKHSYGSGFSYNNGSGGSDSVMMQRDFAGSFGAGGSGRNSTASTVFYPNSERTSGQPGSPDVNGIETPKLFR